ncbi:MAG TPA: AAA family ATPase [Bacillales bacterium]|nr:AAA family ATPase [Bacillales bacterium]
MPHLQSIQLRSREKLPAEPFPFQLPLVQNFQQIHFHAPITFFVGENGTGKSTLLESIAAAADAITIGSEESNPASELADYLKLIWKVKSRKGFFLRADDFINYTKRLTVIRKEMKEELNRVEAEYKDRSILARSLARLPYNRSLAEMEELYQEGLETRSHGESFLQFFHSRLRPDGLYLLDEPETPLSPLKQLSLISLLKEMTAQNCQFIIATHSPILMAFPGATILNFDEHPVHETPYDELEHVKLTKSFLNNPEQFLKHL